MRTIDFAVSEKRWSDEREIWRLDRFTSSVHTAVHILEDGTTHYLWQVDEGQNETLATGVFYQVKDSGRTIKVAGNNEGFKSLGVGKQVVVSNNVRFRVLRDGKAGPMASVKFFDGAGIALSGRYMFLGNGGDETFWFVNSFDLKSLRELTIADGK